MNLGPSNTLEDALVYQKLSWNVSDCCGITKCIVVGFGNSSLPGVQSLHDFPNTNVFIWLRKHLFQ